MTWKYTDATNVVVFRVLPDGSVQSCLASVLSGVTPDPADPLTPAQIAAAQTAKDAVDTAALKLDTKVQQLAGATSAQIASRLNTVIDGTSLATLTPSVKNEMALQESILGILVRKL